MRSDHVTFNDVFVRTFFSFLPISYDQQADIVVYSFVGSAATSGVLFSFMQSTSHGIIRQQDGHGPARVRTKSSDAVAVTGTKTDPWQGCLVSLWDS